MRKTEQRNPKSMHIDEMNTIDMVKVIQEENYNAVRAIDSACDNIAKAIDEISLRMKKGGRLFYVGCGTSGRLGVLDASECPPTFGVSKDLVIGIIAGGEKALIQNDAGEEDRADLGEASLKKYNITSNDSVMGISAAGGAAFVLGAIEYAKSVGALTIGHSSNDDTALLKSVDIPIFTDTGAEVITGSTRMKAGTAQKLVLNMISTGVMIKLGMVYENLMINLRPLNVKLADRMGNIVSDITNVSKDLALQELEKHNWDIKETVKAIKK